MSLGTHCAVSSCRQIDFLPFTCDCCANVYCLEHRTYPAHHCQLAAGKECTAIVCPICAKAIKLVHGQDPNEAFDMHMNQNCDPSNYAKVHKKQKCPVSNCKEKLTTINKYKCKKCAQTICLKHRDPEDHGCDAYRAQQNQLNAGKLGLPLKPAIVSRPPVRPATLPAAPTRPVASSRPPTNDFRNTVQGTAERRMREAEQARLREVCPHCNGRFATVEKLVQHVEEWHPSSGTASTSTGSTLASNRSGNAREQFGCPSCGQTFVDAVRLVEHANKCGTKKTADCVLS